MSVHGPTTDAVLHMVADIVERHVHPASNIAAAPPSMLIEPPLRPIQAVVGQAFPALRTRRSYGRRCEDTDRAGTCLSVQGPSRGLLSPSPAAAHVSSFSAHVQPQEAHPASSADPYAARTELSGPFGIRAPIPGGATQPVLAAGGSAQQRLPAHQWSASEFEQLQSGYYVEPVDMFYSKTSAAGTEGANTTRVTSPASWPSPCVRGEAFFSLLFQCVRSTVRKHQQVALEVLLAHLSGLAGSTTASARKAEAVALRDRCLHGPDCAPFLFFLLEILVSAGHPAMIELAAACLLLLLRGLTRGEPAGARGTTGLPTSLESVLGDCSAVSLVVEAIAELGSPAGDHPEEDTEEGRDTGRGMGVPDSDAEESVDNRDLLFSEVSELLRGPDARLGLEQLGFTNKVMGAMRLLLLLPPSSLTVAAVQQRGEGLKSSCDDVVNQEHQGSVEPTAASLNFSSSSLSTLPSKHAEALFLELLLCGGVGAGRRVTCRRVAEDPSFRTWAEAQLSAVVLGHRRLEDITELLCVLQNLSHIPSALNSLLSGVYTPRWNSAGTPGRESAVAVVAHQHTQHQFYETWLLFFILVCSTSAAEVRTVRHASAILWSMLILRACARLGHSRGSVRRKDEVGEGVTGHAKCVITHSSYGMVQDISDTLLTEGMHVGGGIVMEMWFLQYTCDDGAASAPGHAAGYLDHYFLDAARTALQLCKSPEDGMSPALMTTDDSGGDGLDAVSLEATVARRLLAEFRWTASAHFFSTYIARMRHRSPAVCSTLCSTAVETQEAVRHLMRSLVMNTGRLTNAFARFTSPLLSASWLGSAERLHKSEGSGTHNDTTSGDPTFFNRAPSLHVTTVPPQAAVVSAIHAVVCRWLRDPSGDVELIDGVVEADLAVRDRALLFLCFDAASLYARTRVVSALAEVYPAVAADMALGYAALIVHAFEEACLRMRERAALRLHIDELCTMSVAVQVLQRFGDSGSRSKAVLSLSTLSTTDAPHDGLPSTRYAREVRIGAFFLLHSVAVSKHCLDVVPLFLPLLLLHSPVKTTQGREGEPAAATMVSITEEAAELQTLMDSLQSGIELTPIPVVLGSATDATGMVASSSSEAAVTLSGAPRCWALYPLFDDSFAAKNVWASWLRRLLGLDQHVKDVLGWDGVLCHTLLWTLSHRRELWVTGGYATCEVAEAGVSSPVLSSPSSPSSWAAALCEVMVDLCSILHAQSTRSADPHCSADSVTVISAAASRTLEISLVAYSDAPSEEGVPLLVHALLAYVAAHCSARTALAALQVLLATPVLPPSFTIGKEVDVLGECGDEDKRSCAPKQTAPGLRATSPTAQVCAWLHSWAAHQRWKTQSARSVSWSLDDVVALVQLVGPHFRNDDSSERGSPDRPGAGSESTQALTAPQEALLAPSVTGPEVAATDSMWCARCLTEGLLQFYMQQRIATSGGLSMIEKMALRSTLEDLGWFPTTLWPHVKDA
ncbi:hypothetical protein JKF63_03877 [Porcisia hertigi]|uniref:Uncharacterized protein n=1 Tax=Porcisia hertigi TaxID=2761500 RepID=A0A836I3M5_9TRYP|nr:hypothetical protein JKF63_03877 [Porcisia hertigi]